MEESHRSVGQDTPNRRHGLWVKKRYVALVTVLIISGVVVWAYAATFLAVSNVANIETGASLLATGPVTPVTACSLETGTYTNSPTVDWGSVPTGARQSKFICVENVGTGNYVVSLTSDLPSGDGSISSPQIGQIISTGSFLLVEVDWDVSTQATLGSVSYTISFQ